MTSDSEDLKPPAKFPARKATRDVAEAAVQSIPVVGPFLAVAAALGKTTLPNAEEIAREQWEAGITTRVNEHHATLHPTATIEGAAADLARWIARKSETGLEDPVAEVADIIAEFAQHYSEDEISEALGELSILGFVEVSKDFGGGYVLPRSRLFAVVDPHVMGWSPTEDARELARRVLGAGDSFSAAEVDAEIGWGPRRFNAALAVLLAQFDQADVPTELDPRYLAPYAYISPATRLRLRRLLG